MAPKRLQAEWVRLWITSLADAGVERVVLSPGSRSTPLVLAVAEEPRFSVIDAIDERAAAYFALGQARVTHRPTLLICTSGTAGANYLPAVLEARHAGLPLLIVTADRPVELQGCGANQTIDQNDLYGGHVRAFFDLGSPEASPLALRALRRTAAQAVLATRFPLPGAVHCNLRLRKPLEPPLEEGPSEEALETEVDEILARTVPRPAIPEQVPARADLEALAARCRETEAGVVVCGPADLSHRALGPLVAELGRRTGFPILCDPASQLRRASLEAPGVVWADTFDALFHVADLRRRLRPRLVLQVGRAPTSGAWDRALGEMAAAGEAPEHWVLTDRGWQDPQSTADRSLCTDLAPALRRLLEILPEEGRSGAWTETWREAETAGRSVVAEELAGEVGLSEGAVARGAVEALPAEGLLVAGNSLPIRQLDIWGGRGEHRVLSQRGTSGIEGLVAGAAGAASVSGDPTILLIGDVSFAHDLSGLVLARKLESPLALVVVQNRGGRIFEQLPVSRHPAAEGELHHWTTPPELDLAAAAAMVSIPFTRVESRAELDSALGSALAHHGVSLIEAVVPESGARARNRALWERLARWAER